MQKSCFALIVQAATRGNFKGFLETPHVLIQVLSTTGFPSVSWILQPRDWNQTFHLIPAGLWIHRNEELRWWASSFLLFPRNKAEEVKKCSKHKKLCPAQEEQRPTCDCTFQERDTALPPAELLSCRTHLENVKFLLLEQILASPAAQQHWLLTPQQQWVGSSLFPAQELYRSFQKMHQLQKFSLEEFC